MRANRKVVCRAMVLCVGVIGMMSFAAQARDADDGWRWSASLYGWFPSIDGTTRFPSGAGSPSIEVDTDDILDALKFTFMGALDVRRGQWGIFTDLVYTDLGGSKSGSRDFRVGQVGLPAGVDGNASLDIKTWIWTLAGSYVLGRTPQNTTQALFGTRMIDMSQTLDWSFNGDIGSLELPGRGGRAEVDVTNWDAIVGLKGVATLSADRRWVLPYYVDVGTGESELTWQALAAVGYSFDWGTTTLGWRYLDYDLKSDAKIESINFSGLFVGLTFQW